MKFEKFTMEDYNKKPTELFEDVSCDEVLVVKDLPIDDKELFIKYCFENQIKNTYFVLNAVLMIKGVEFSDELFDADELFFKDFEEYLDIKLDLKDTLDEVYKNIVLFSLGCIKGCSTTLPDVSTDISEMYGLILTQLDFVDIGKLMNKVTFTSSDIPFVADGKDILNFMSSKSSLFSSLI